MQVPRKRGVGGENTQHSQEGPSPRVAWKPRPGRQAAGVPGRGGGAGQRGLVVGSGRPGPFSPGSGPERGPTAGRREREAEQEKHPWVPRWPRERAQNPGLPPRRSWKPPRGRGRVSGGLCPARPCSTRGWREVGATPGVQLGEMVPGEKHLLVGDFTSFLALWGEYFPVQREVMLGGEEVV